MAASRESTFRQFYSSDAFATLVVSSAVFTDMFIYDLIVPFLPQMLEDRLDIPTERVQLWTSILLGVFGGCFLCGNLIAGAVIDSMPSKRPMFLLGLVTMTASCLIFFLGTHIALTILARALQGVSATLVWVPGLAFLTSHINSRNIGWAMGCVSIGMGAGELMGPVVGGIMYEHTGHYSVLALTCVILGTDMVLRVLMMEKPPERNGYSSDSSRSSSSEDEESPLLAERQAEPQDTPIGQDCSQPSTFDVLGLKTNRDLGGSCFAVVNNGIILFALESPIVIFVAQHFGWTTSASGGVMFAFVAPNVFSPAIGDVVLRHGPRWASVVIFLIGGIALLGLGFLTNSTTITKLFFVIVITVVGTCIGALTTIHHTAFSVAVKRMEEQAKRDGSGASGSGKSFGSLLTAWATGMCIGPLLADFFLEKFGWLGMCLFLAALSFVCAFVMSFTWLEWENPECEE